MPSSSSSLLQLQRIIFLLTIPTIIALVSFEGMNIAFLSGATRRTASSTSNKLFVNAFTSTPTRPRVAASSRFTVTRTMMTEKNVNSNVKPGIASFDELIKFVNDAGTNLVVVDVRNPDESKEPGDQKSLAVASLPSPADNIRPNAVSLIWDRDTASMPLPSNDTVSKDTPIITHCGGGGRGQKAKDYLELNGYTNVVNGAGPKETELWKLYGDK